MAHGMQNRETQLYFALFPDLLHFEPITKHFLIAFCWL